MSGAFLLSGPGGAVEGAIGDSLEEMGLLDMLRSFDIRNRAGYFQDSVIRTGGETQFGHREFQQFITFIIQSAVCTHHLGTHHGIAMHQPAVFKTLILNGSGF